MRPFRRLVQTGKRESGSRLLLRIQVQVQSVEQHLQMPHFTIRKIATQLQAFSLSLLYSIIKSVQHGAATATTTNTAVVPPLLSIVVVCLMEHFCSFYLSLSKNICLMVILLMSTISFRNAIVDSWCRLKYVFEEATTGY